MTDYFVGPGGSDTNNGLTYATRFLTVAEAEAHVSPGDSVYFAPGTYHDVTIVMTTAGTEANPIKYIGDPTGEMTDGVGGQVIFVSYNQYAVPTSDYTEMIKTLGWREFHKITFGGGAIKYNYNRGLHAYNYEGLLTVHDCVFANCYLDTGYAFGPSQDYGIDVRRCYFEGFSAGALISMTKASFIPTYRSLFEGCYFANGQASTYGVNIGLSIGSPRGTIVRNCTFTNLTTGVRLGKESEVHSCVFNACYLGVKGATDAQAIYTTQSHHNTYINCYNEEEDTYTFYPGTNSFYFSRWSVPTLGLNAKIPNTLSPIVTDGGFGDQSARSLYHADYAHDNDISPHALLDIYGTDIPQNWMRQRGASQSVPVVMDTEITFEDSPSALRLKWWGRHQIFVPTNGVETQVTVSVMCGTSYVGSPPQISIKQPGQTPILQYLNYALHQFMTTTFTFTPAAIPKYFILELGSNNTGRNYATGAMDATWANFDNLKIEEV